ncbi:MAG: holo-ACP synthase [Parasulfuritortus sp.]|jgi:holo-[acyl-carrier protein] synthase|nr:holo-ACP synthase [Parasulfuritortus sp.]
MIRGIGVDLVTVTRMAGMIERHDERLAKRILAPAELEEYAAAQDKARFLAKRFAAKEAVAKALGTGLRAPVHMERITITHDDLGRPGFAFSGELQDWLTERRIGNIHLSISDERDHAVAFVIAED